VARGGSPIARIAIALLGIAVLALVVSGVYGRWGARLPGLIRRAPRQPVRVQVLNGSGEGGIATRVATFLRDGGFQVVEISNADRPDYFATIVVARREDPSGAEAVARYLGGPPVIRQRWDSDMADVTVVIGGDRSQLRLEP
jgi:hypothetical protein